MIVVKLSSAPIGALSTMYIGPGPGYPSPGYPDRHPPVVEWQSHYHTQWHSSPNPPGQPYKYNTKYQDLLRNCNMDTS